MTTEPTVEIGTPVGAGELPHHLRVWDNQARSSIRGGLLVWLAILVGTTLASMLFVFEHVPARFALGGFLASHGWVIVLGQRERPTLRVGMVSLTHLLCWTPGFVLAILDNEGRALGGGYVYWSWAYVVVVAISFVFDLRDGGRFLIDRSKGRVPP